MAKRFWADLGHTDTDGDGLSDDFEYVLGTDPKLRDTDGDGMNDLRERDFGSNPLSKDSDGDKVDDLREVIVGTNPQHWDTDGDNIDDHTEIVRGTAHAPDADRDGKADWLDPRDSDHDRLTDLDERWLRTNPNNEDTDLDGHSDFFEVLEFSDPRLPPMVDPPLGPGSGGRYEPPPEIYNPDPETHQPPPDPGDSWLHDGPAIGQADGASDDSNPGVEVTMDFGTLA